jgi:hypothetical protein
MSNFSDLKLMDVRPEKPNESLHHHECSGCGSRALTRVRRQEITDHLLAALFGLRPLRVRLLRQKISSAALCEEE